MDRLVVACVVRALPTRPVSEPEPSLFQAALRPTHPAEVLAAILVLVVGASPVLLFACALFGS